MGIQDINQLLKDSNYKDTAGLDLLENRRIAIDAFNWIYTFMSSAFKSVVYKKDFDFENDVDQQEVFRVIVRDILTFIQNLMDIHITPVLVWDGVHPVFKTEAKNKRRLERAKRIAECDKLLEELRSKKTISRNSPDVKVWKDKFCQNSRLDGPILSSLKDIVESLGVPSIQADADAERLCAELNRRGLVAAVWSRDTDLYALGCPCMIVQIDFGSSSFDYIDGSKILTHLDLEPEELLDLCIMCGCDYNNRIKGLGPKKSFKLIKEHKSCDRIPNVDISCLNLHECRKLLSVPESPHEITSEELMVNPQKCESGHEILSFYSMEYMFPQFYSTLRNCGIPSDINFD